MNIKKVGDNYSLEIKGTGGYNIGKPIYSNIEGKNEISGTANYIGIINGNLDTSNFTSKISDILPPVIIKREFLPDGLSGDGIDIKYNYDTKMPRE